MTDILIGGPGLTPKEARAEAREEKTRAKAEAKVKVKEARAKAREEKTRAKAEAKEAREEKTRAKAEAKVKVKEARAKARAKAREEKARVKEEKARARAKVVAAFPKNMILKFLENKPDCGATPYELRRYINACSEAGSCPSIDVRDMSARVSDLKKIGKIIDTGEQRAAVAGGSTSAIYILRKYAPPSLLARQPPQWFDVIREDRERLGLSINELAKQAGLKEKRYQAVEEGRGKLSLAEGIAIGRVLGPRPE